MTSPWTIIAVAVEPAARALATEGMCELRSPAGSRAELPEGAIFQRLATGRGFVPVR
jgi:hypothetical protein